MYFVLCSAKLPHASCLFFPGFYYGLLISAFFSSQVSVIRGQVLYKNGQPLIGVKVGSLSNPAYGYTLTRQNGM
jgi:hypothetical protein